VELLISNRNCYEYFNSTATLLRPSKKLKVEQLSSITIGYIATIMGSNNPINWKSMRILLDSGCAATLINQDLVKTLKTTKENRTKWTTKAGNFSTHRKCEIIFTLPALHKHRQITWNCYVDKSNAKSISYDSQLKYDEIMPQFQFGEIYFFTSPNSVFGVLSLE
jgi:excinuclease UvrABC helicase subunit UvrB